ncbi:hypothetical protein V5G24_22960 [Xanthobacter sp. VTT E-85241]|uniref:hypothetical protein n=1 Tax=Roseixanthobacter finlandensis TaxID=3119922 RepID=UPI003727046D
MKINLKLLGVTALVFASSAAHAVTTTWSQYERGHDFTVSRARVTSGTTPAALGAIQVDPKKDVTISLKASTPVSVTLSRMLSDSTVLGSEAIAVGTSEVSRTFSAPQTMEAIGVSATTALSAGNNVSVTVIQSKE